MWVYVLVIVMFISFYGSCYVFIVLVIVSVMFILCLQWFHDAVYVRFCAFMCCYIYVGLIAGIVVLCICRCLCCVVVLWLFVLVYLYVFVWCLCFGLRVISMLISVLLFVFVFCSRYVSFACVPVLCYVMCLCTCVYVYVSCHVIVYVSGYLYCPCSCLWWLCLVHVRLVLVVVLFLLLICSFSFFLATFQCLSDEMVRSFLCPTPLHNIRDHKSAFDCPFKWPRQFKYVRCHAIRVVPVLSAFSLATGYQKTR